MEPCINQTRHTHIDCKWNIRNVNQCSIYIKMCWIITRPLKWVQFREWHIPFHKVMFPDWVLTLHSESTECYTINSHSQAHSGDSMRDRHNHCNLPFVDCEMRTQRTTESFLFVEERFSGAERWTGPDSDGLLCSHRSLEGEAAAIEARAKNGIHDGAIRWNEQPQM